jgi:hypothetical protein
MSKPICKICGRPEEEHHAFDPVVAPDGCECDPLFMVVAFGRFFSVCDKFETSQDSDIICRKCMHPERCHK